jgi:hypothetical protein
VPIFPHQHSQVIELAVSPHAHGSGKRLVGRSGIVDFGLVTRFASFLDWSGRSVGRDAKLWGRPTTFAILRATAHCAPRHVSPIERQPAGLPRVPFSQAIYFAE